MATDLYQLDRIRNLLSTRPVQWEEKKMFGGICFMVNDKMCFGISKRGLMVRVEPNEVIELEKRIGASQMIHGGRPMTGYLFIAAEGYDNDGDLEFWIQKCLDFNPKASKKK